MKMIKRVKIKKGKIQMKKKMKAMKKKEKEMKNKKKKKIRKMNKTTKKMQCRRKKKGLRMKIWVNKNKIKSKTNHQTRIICQQLKSLKKLNVQKNQMKIQ